VTGRRRSRPVFVSQAIVLALHEEQLAEHGGRAGLKDEGLLDSALARPRNLLAYERPDIAGLAAAYAFGIVKNYPFVDGNKRVSFVATELFLDLKGYRLDLSDAEVVKTWLALAAGEIGEDDLAERLRAAIRPAAT
jgi:death on curing protein